MGSSSSKQSEQSPNNKQRLFFCISPGRCGSHYLTQLLATADNVVCDHEPEPQLIDEYMEMCTAKRMKHSFAKRKFKATSIKKKLGALPAGTTYGEMSHMFIKTFWDVVLSEFPRSRYQIDVIILRRYLPAVLMSRVKLGHFGKRPVHGWMYTTNSANSLIPPIAPDREQDQYDLLIGYLLDIEAQAMHFQALHPDIRCVQVRLEHLNTKHGVQHFFEQLDVKMTPETLAVIGHKTNERTEEKQKANIDTTLEYCEQRVQQYIEKCAHKNIPLPPLPHMTPAVT